MWVLQVLLIGLWLLGQPALSFSSRFPSSFITRPIVSSSSLFSTPSSSSQQHHPPTALILIDHGSPMKEANDRLAALSHKLGSLLQSSPRCNIIHTSHCHMELSSPTLHEAVISALSLHPSLRRVVVHPYFLGQGKHVTLDIPRIVESVRDAVILGHRRAKHGGLLPKVAGASAEDSELQNGFWEGEIVLSAVVGSEEDLMLKTVLQAVGRAVGDTSQHRESAKPTGVKAVSTSDAPAAMGPYSQGVVSGNMLFVSGCLGIDPVNGELAAGVAAQASQALRNLKAVIEAEPYKGAVTNVVKTTVMLKDMSDFNTVNEIYSKFFVKEQCNTMPARSCFAVKELPKGALVEIEAIVAKS